MDQKYFAACLSGILSLTLAAPAIGKSPSAIPSRISGLSQAVAAGNRVYANQLRQLALSLVNQVRRQTGAPRLVNNALLNQVAQAHAEDMIRQNYLSHYGKDGSTPEQRVRSAGGAMFTGENILSYHLSGKRRRSDLIVEFQSLFFNSPRHRTIMMRSRYSQFGYGLANAPDGRVVAVQMFGIPDQQ